MPNGILHQRLQHQGGHQAVQRLRLDVLFDAQLVAESGLLNFQITLDKLPFVAEGEFLPLRLAEGQAQ